MRAVASEAIRDSGFFATTWWQRERTTVTLKWVSEELALGHYTRVSQAVSRMQRQPGKKLEQLKRRLLQTEKKET